MRDRKMFYGAGRKIFRNAFLLRRAETEAEKLLWQRLSKSQLGQRFKRQHPVAYFIADFYCHKSQLIIEIDGGYHDVPEQKRYDEDRTKVLEELGLKVIRFTNREVIENLEVVVEKIMCALR